MIRGAAIIQGSVAADYNGLTQPPPTVYQVQNVTADCDFSTPANTAQPYYLYNVVQGLTLDNVTIGGTVYNTTLSV